MKLWRTYLGDLRCFVRAEDEEQAERLTPAGRRGVRPRALSDPLRHQLCPAGCRVSVAKSAELSKQGGHVRADPFFGDEAVVDAVELVADVLDGAAGGGEALELAPRYSAPGSSASAFTTCATP